VPDEVLAGLATLAGGPPLWGDRVTWAAVLPQTIKNNQTCRVAENGKMPVVEEVRSVRSLF
jgi:hypothetical protein